MASEWERKSLEKIIKPKDLPKLVQDLRKSKKTIATLNGSFDLMHAGHLHMLYQASLQADVLILALNTDASIKKYKDPSRPVIPLKYRLQMMAAISFVDFVTYFKETTPKKILSVIAPDVHVNGAEYGENCLEADIVKQNGGKIHIVTLKDGLSTSKLIQKIKETCVL